MTDETTNDEPHDEATEGPPCKHCGCSGYLKNPLVSGDCLRCHHDFFQHG